MSETDYLNVLTRVYYAIKELRSHGVTIRTILFNGGKPTIRITRCAYCDRQIENGTALYQSFGCGPCGHYKQGVFMLDGCKVVWSESLH
ncbi:hypothetical protein [Limnobaculum xujianqingii]|nr:hypothetical protein [Limnobaculum xujianqingii]MBK5072541.1 hypothetical protein [Limnobaculum xujianqingii]